MYIVLLYLAVLGLAGYSIFGEKKLDDRIEKIVFLAIMVFFLLRLNMGSDTKNYMLIFEDMPSSYLEAVNYSNMRYPVFSLMMFAVKKLGGDFYVFTALVNLLVISLMTYTMYKESKNLYLSLLVFLGSGIMMVYYTSAMRQMICMAVFFFAYYKFLQKDHYAAYYLCTLPLVFIQEVSLIALVVPILYRFRKFFTSKFGYILIVILTGLGVLAVNLGSVIYSIIPSNFAALLAISGSASLMGIALQVALLIMLGALVYMADKGKLDDKDRFQILLCVCSSLIYFVFMKNQLASRASDFLQILYLSILPKLIISIPEKKKKVLCFAGTAALMTVLLASDFNDNLHSRYFDSSIVNYPYVSIFNMQDGKYYYAFGDIDAKPQK